MRQRVGEDVAVRYLKVKNFRRFQHYKDRKPPWVKLYRDLWHDREFFRLTSEAKLLLIGFLTIASVVDNQIPEDADWIAAELSLPPKLINGNIELLISAGFLCVEQDASNLLADCPQDATDHSIVETETETETDQDYSRKNNLSASQKPSSPIVAWPEADTWLKNFLEHDQKAFNGTHLPSLLDHDWWDAVSIAVNGVDQPFLATEFAKMHAWLKENRSREPTPRGVRKFVRGWLERASDRARRGKLL